MDAATTTGAGETRGDVGLVLSRHKSEQIIIGHGDIVLTLVDLRGDKARIGILADREIAVHRLETYQKLVAEGVLPPPEPGSAAWRAIGGADGGAR